MADEDDQLRALREKWSRTGFDFMVPPRTVTDAAAWDKYWNDQVEHGDPASTAVRTLREAGCARGPADSRSRNAEPRHS